MCDAGPRLNQAKVRIRSKLTHEPTVGDGIRGFVSHSRRGLLRSATVHGKSEQIDVEAMETEAGDTIDFVVDIREGLNSDQFLWSLEIGLEDVNATPQNMVLVPAQWEVGTPRHVECRIGRKANFVARRVQC